MASRAVQLGDAAFPSLVPIIARQALLARLEGRWRAVLEYERATRRRYRRPMQLSRRDDEDRKDREALAWLIAFLGMSDGEVQTMTGESVRLAKRATAGIEIPVMKRIERATLRGEALTEMPTQPATSNPLDPFGDYGRRDVLADLFPRFTVKERGDIFDRAGVGRTNTHTLDLWAETVAYSQYEAGRDDIHKTPQVREVLWGYRWSSILDDRTTLGCRHLDGWVAPLDDRWMTALMPPRHFNCRSVLVPVWQSSALSKPPEPIPPRATDDDLGRYLDEKLEFIGFINKP